MLTVPQPSRGETSTFLAQLALPTFCSTFFEPEDAPRPGRVPGRTLMCTPVFACAGVTAEIAVAMAAHVQATSTTFRPPSPNHGVWAGQWVPLGPYERIGAGRAIAAAGAPVVSVAVGVGVAVGQGVLMVARFSVGAHAARAATGAAMASALSTDLRSNGVPFLGLLMSSTFR